MMSSQGQAQKPLVQDEKEEEDFYDCLETPDLREDKTQQEAGGSQDFHTKTETLHQEELGGGPHDGEQGDGQQQEEELGGGPQEGEQGDAQQEVSDLKHDNSEGVQFDDDYLREVEKDLTEEEKESRRQQSLTMKEEGNQQFKAGDWLEAECRYTEALGLCPLCFNRERAVLFSNRAAARHHLDLKDQAISDCTRAIELNSDYLRALLRRAELYEQTDKLDEALEDYKRVLERDPNQASARQACMRLPQQIQERNEKLKEEMISKLKDLGNMFLRPFGLSTNNFQVNQDQETGSYSINFVQNPNNR
ncbi:tetratricopeptide repeat protein 1 [Betta splendens]|uniref:Tetratricopeptide repeat protein 1 n=1 Tax=Betta splendens TaxID=158456 RepID=A0A6P7PD46_BETSP|nr:tetratricopeptide repeat protein 1 [Betta splendens]XP_029030119.1 tetratricopeptide repeat protein 1 [Betta splendens]XP_029030120.1 tetratricopeptide repeat protein 1 [Betta splendens]XP_029030121.1 tetratricopeptide repeat protein 1 [Betta splendens]